MQIFKLSPTFKDYIWGGRRLVTDFGKRCDYERVAESWELSCHPDGASVITGGEYDGVTLSEYIAQQGSAVLGTNGARFSEFPILIKLIDARDNLSVQVHPDDEYAKRVEGGFGKTEMWYIVDCEEDAKLLYGFTKDISKEEFSRRIEDNTLLEVTNAVSVKKGDVFFIEAGTLHAIGSGILIAEIQQSSNLTYRVYDYGRVGADGKPRELHIDKAVDVTTLTPPSRPPRPMGEPEQMEGYTQTLLAQCDYFTVYNLDIKKQAELALTEQSFQSLLCLSGKAVIEGDSARMEIAKGESVFLPASQTEQRYTITGECEVLLTSV